MHERRAEQRAVREGRENEEKQHGGNRGEKGEGGRVVKWEDKFLKKTQCISVGGDKVVKKGKGGKRGGEGGRESESGKPGGWGGGVCRGRETCHPGRVVSHVFHRLKKNKYKKKDFSSPALSPFPPFRPLLSSPLLPQKKRVLRSSASQKVTPRGRVFADAVLLPSRTTPTPSSSISTAGGGGENNVRRTSGWVCVVRVSQCGCGCVVCARQTCGPSCTAIAELISEVVPFVLRSAPVSQVGVGK